MPNSKDIIGNKPNLPPSEEVQPLPQTPLPAVNALSADPQARNPYFTEPLPSVGTPADPDQLRNFLRAGVSQYRTTPPPIVPSSTSTAVSVSTIAQTVVDNTVSSSVIPLTILRVGHEWLDSFSSASGLFTQSQPSFSDISGTLINSQLPTSGVVAGSYTITNLTVNAQGIVTAASNGSSSGGVTSLNGETGVISIVAGTGITVTTGSGSPPGGDITVSQAVNAGSLSFVTTSSPPATINLSTVGTKDWLCLNGATTNPPRNGYNGGSGVTAAVHSKVLGSWIKNSFDWFNGGAGSPSVGAGGSSGIAFTSSASDDIAPALSASTPNVTENFVSSGQAIHFGYRFEVPADTTTHTLVLNWAVFSTKATVTCHFSDGSLADQTTTLDAVSNGAYVQQQLTITYLGGTFNGKLIVSVAVTTNYNTGGNGGVYFISATLA